MLLTERPVSFRNMLYDGSKKGCGHFKLTLRHKKVQKGVLITNQASFQTRAR